MQDLPPVPPAKSPSTSPVLAYRAPSYGLAHSESAQYQQQHGEHEQTIQLSPNLQKSLANPHSPAFLKRNISESEHSVLTNPMSLTDNNHQMTTLDQSFPPRRQTPMGFQSLESVAVDEPTGITGSQLRPRHSCHENPPVHAHRHRGGQPPATTARLHLGHHNRQRRPTTTSTQWSHRLPPTARSHRTPASPTDLTPRLPSSPSNSRVITRNRVGMDESAADALAALSFLEQDERSTSPPQAKHQVNRSPPQSSARVVPQILEPDDGRAPSPQGSQYRSSFALSKQASERKARSQAQQAAHDEAVHNQVARTGSRSRGKEAVVAAGMTAATKRMRMRRKRMKMRTMRKTRGKKKMMSGRPVSTDKNHGGQIAAPVGRNPILQNQYAKFLGARRWTPPRCSNLPCTAVLAAIPTTASPDSSPDSSGIQRPFARRCVLFYTHQFFFRLLISRTGPDRRYDQSADGMRAFTI